MTEQAKASPGKKAIDYAENDLGVHNVYLAADASRTKLDGVLTKIVEKRIERRDIEAAVEVAEMDIVINERSKHADMSQAQMDKHVKAAFVKDSALAGLRAKVRDLQGDIDGLEFDRDIAETDIKISTARMIELGGYFQYLAVIKGIQGGSNARPLAAQPTIPGW